ncbi:ABC transporter permease [Spiroplasma sp. TIUS-1]|uniref:ABC transporter permease n=1 Tax=Spiroplasma sp. TIUS-1 TaxID=216963 RepID=UPI001398B7FA|nr:ABC transporter permease [Spiroplasma sp. TIUS-1]QHX35779.1 ABC transporter permease [Spiroplasma sp. TIUS-1]
MRRIFKSYLKLFISSWLETLGTLLFLITFIIVILSMLPAPLQISLMANRTNKQTNQWDYSVHLDADNVSGTNVMDGNVNSFSSEFLQEVTKNFLKGKLVEKARTTPNQDELKKRYEENKNETVNDVYKLTSKSNDHKYISFKDPTEILNSKSKVKDQSGNNILFTDWFINAEMAIIEIINIIQSESPKLRQENDYYEKRDKYMSDVLIQAASIYSSWGHNSSLGGSINDDYFGIKKTYLNIISNVVGYNFTFDSSWSEENTQKYNAHNNFKKAFDGVLVKDIFKQEVLDYYYLDGHEINLAEETSNISMQRDIWNAIQTNVYEQLGFKYTRENTIYTIADIGNNKSQAVNFTEIFDESAEKDRVNNLVYNGKGWAADTGKLDSMNVFGNDKFFDSISSYDNKFKINGIDVRLQNTYVAYKLNGITSKKDSYNYSFFNSNPKFTGELYVGQETFKEIYDKFIYQRDSGNDNFNGKPFLKMSTTFYLAFGKSNSEEQLSFLRGNVSNSTPNIYSIDTSYIYSKDKSPQLKMITMVNLMTIIYIVIGTILLLLASVFMLYSQKEELNRTRKQLGVFKSNGYKTWELSLPSTLKVFLLMFIGLLVGYLCSFPLQMNAVDKQFGSIAVFSIARIYANPAFLFILFVCVPSIFTSIIFLILLHFLSERPLDLMSQSSVTSFVRHPWWYWLLLPVIFPFVLLHKLFTWLFNKTRWGFTFKFQAAFLSISKGKFTIVMILFSFATYLVSMEMKAMPVMNNMFNEATSFLKSSTDHESSIYGDDLGLPDKNGYQKIYESSFIGRQFVDLKGDSIEDFLKKQHLESNSKEKVMDDFVFNAHALVSRMFDERIKFLEKTKFLNEDLQNIAMKISSVFSIGSLVLPVEISTTNSFDKIEEKSNKLFTDIKNLLFNIPENLKDEIRKLLNNYILEIKAIAFDNVKNKESLLTSKLSESYEQIQKVKAIQGNDIFKMTWMLLSGWTGSMEASQLSDIKDIKKYIADITNTNIPQVYSSSYEDSNEDPIESIIKWIQEVIKDILEFLSVEENVEIVENSISNSNFVQYLLQPLLLTQDGIDPLITNNSVIFDSKKETLVRHENVRIEGHNYYSTLMSFDSSGKFGDLRNQYLFDGVWNWNDLGKKNNDGSINVIVSKPIQKLKNLKVGDKIELYDKRSSDPQKPVVGKVIGVQVRNIAVHMVFADYDRLIEARTPEESELRKHKFTFKIGKEEYTYDNVYAFNKVISSKKKISLPIDEIGINITDLMDKFSYMQDSYQFMTEAKKIKDINWFTSMIAGSSYLDKVLAGSHNKQFISSSSYFSSVPSTSDIMSSYAVIKSGAAAMISIITNMMIVNIVISLILLLILFTVLIKIIIYDAQGIIILMRSLGYKDIQINWIVMGKYLTSSIWSFVIMYTLSFFTWTVIAEFAWSKYAVILAIPIYWYLPFLIFLVMESVITIGFLFGVYRLKKLPLARL